VNNETDFENCIHNYHYDINNYLLGSVKKCSCNEFCIMMVNVNINLQNLFMFRKYADNR